MIQHARKLLWALAALPLMAQAIDPPAQAEEEQKTAGGFRFRLARRPAIRIGNFFRAEFRLKVQDDFRGFSPPQITDDGMFVAKQLRVGVEGRVLNDFEYEVEYELRPADHPWRDVFVNYRRLRPFQIKVGKFKVPFGLDQLTSPTDLEFVYRSRLGSYLAPARDRGVLAHGRFFDRGLGYQAGYFLHDGENAELKSNQPSGGRTLAGRLTARPLQFLSLPAALRAVELAGALTQTHLPEGVNGLRAHTVSGDTFFDRVFVKGRRWRTGAELNWTWDPFSVKGEYADVRDQRQGQGLRGNDLSDVLSRAWYVSATYSLLRKEQGRKRMIPQAVLLDGKTGTVQLAARYEQIRFGSADHPGRPSRTPRAANILGNSDRVWTFGVNWYLNRYAKILGNAIHETIEDVQRAPVAGHDRYWMWVARLQFVM